VAPQPARHADLARAIGEALGVPWQDRVPADQVVEALGGASELLLHSHRLVPARALAHGFDFAHPDITGAVRDIVAA
jgi:NAD dependent epimerase/dehydratase family enzyme